MHKELQLMEKICSRSIRLVLTNTCPCFNLLQELHFINIWQPNLSMGFCFTYDCSHEACFLAATSDGSNAPLMIYLYEKSAAFFIFLRIFRQQ